MVVASQVSGCAQKDAKTALSLLLSFSVVAEGFQARVGAKLTRIHSLLPCRLFFSSERLSPSPSLPSFSLISVDVYPF